MRVKAMEEKALFSPKDAVAEALIHLCETDDRIVVLNADISSYVGLHDFASRFPERTYNLGVAEQDLVLTAAGMALAGKIPYAVSYASFLAGRAYDAMRNAVAMPNLPVRFVAVCAGITAGEEGAAYQALEDIALMRALPKMTVLVPADFQSTRRLLLNSLSWNGPLYIRLGCIPLPQLYGTDDGFPIGGGRLLREGKSVTICACGIMVHEAMKAAAVLARQGIEAEVIDCYSIKPLPVMLIQSSLRRTGCCVVAEEHNIIGGLGSAVAEIAATTCPIPIRFVGVEDRFGQSGSPEELQEYYALTHQHIVSAAAQVWPLRRR